MDWATAFTEDTLPRRYWLLTEQGNRGAELKTEGFDSFTSQITTASILPIPLSL